MDACYYLNEEGNLAYLEVAVVNEGNGLLFVSPVDGAEYKIKGMSEYDLIDALKNLGWSKWLDEILSMVATMGGGKWDDDPDGTQTSYEYDEETRTLIIREG